MKNKKQPPPLYQALGETVRRGMRKERTQELLIGPLVRSLRTASGLRGVDLCARAGDLDPRTLTALEKGRIRNPSLKTLGSVCRGLEISIGDLFKEAELSKADAFYVGSQKGHYEINFRSPAIKVIGFTPFIRNFFYGKLLVGARQRLEETLFRHPHPIFISTLVGRFEVTLEKRKLTLREGENVFFHGNLRHSFYNPLQRESVLLLITAPSFLKG